MNLDTHNLIVQADGDGGDTAQRMGMWWFFQWVRVCVQGAPCYPPDKGVASMGKAWRLLEISPGVYIRNPDKWNDPADFSRDQQRPNLVMMGAHRDLDRLRDLFMAQVKRFGRYQNKDWPSPSNLGEYIRAFYAAGDAWFALGWPLLCFCDLFLVLASMINVGWIPQVDSSAPYFKFPKPWDTDDNNAVITLLQAKVWLPTPVSDLARLIYCHFRPKNAGNSLPFTETDPILGAFAYYHRKESGGNPEFVELVRPVIQYLRA